MTTFANKTNGARVNVEIDSQTRVTVDTVEAYLASMRTLATKPGGDQR
jgi:hypothetical protein